jgi:hypothetical protein
MEFILVMVALGGMGAWVFYQILFGIPKMKAQAEASGAAKRPKPALYWAIIAAQMLFLAYCLHRLYRLISP